MRRISDKVLIVVAVLITVTVLAVPFVAYLLTPPPTIEIKGNRTVTIEAGDTFKDPGAVAFKGKRTITDKMHTSGSVNTSKVGTYTISYTVEPEYLKDGARAERTVNVVDTTPPEIKLKGSPHVALYVGEAYKDEGCSAFDRCDGNLDRSIEETGSVDTAKPGSYKLEYVATDSHGNIGKVSRTVVVVPRVVPATFPASKTIYLTFDDGPSRNTESLLRVLNTHKAKATFFVIGQNKKYFSLMAQESRAGHKVAPHTFTHNYKQIYASEGAFMNDLSQIKKVIKDQTKQDPYILRFPGGSSNTVSRFNPGIMTKLTKQIEADGYAYFDWNVLSGDADGQTLSADTLSSNVIQGIESLNRKKPGVSPVVLMHDSSTNTHVAEAVEKIIVWGQEHGYVFAPLNEKSAPVHQNVAN